MANSRLTDANLAASEALNSEGKPVNDSAKESADSIALRTTASGGESGISASESSDVVLERLARQMEYYFSTVNLAKDTYVSTLRSLNDGYVPISIIANFGKVQALVPYDAMNAVRRAALETSDLLEVVQINANTGKKVDDETVAATPDLQTVEAIGPSSGNPIPMALIPELSPAAVLKPIPSPVQNTLIVREVPEGTEEQHIRDLFTFDKCPPIQSLHLDVANCWFVTLDTDSKDDMFNVMFALRTKKFPSGESVNARLKSMGAPASSASPVNMRYIQPDNPMLYAPQLQSGRNVNGKKGNNGRKKRNNSGASGSVNKLTLADKSGKGKNLNGSAQRRGTSNNGQTKQQMKKGSGSRQQDGRDTNTKVPSPPQTPPNLGDEQFPALPSEELKKVEVEKVPEERPEEDDLEKNRANSDSASTATTTSSSSSSKNAHTPQPQIGGYAAALLKAAPPNPIEKKEMKRPQNSGKDENKASNKKVQSAAASNGGSKLSAKGGKESESDETVAVQPPSWGRGRSFADVLRKETASVVANTPEQATI